MNMTIQQQKAHRDVEVHRAFDIDRMTYTDESNLWIDNQPASELSSCE